MTGLLGRLLIFSGCTILGVSQGRALTQRTQCLEQFRVTLAELSRELAFSLRPLPELAEQAARHSIPPVSDFFTACQREFSASGGESWAESWHRTLEHLDLPLLDSDCRILREAGHILGRYDGEAQQKALTGVLTRLERAEEEARARAGRLFRVDVVLGVSAGLFWLILLW